MEAWIQIGASPVLGWSILFDVSFLEKQTKGKSDRNGNKQMPHDARYRYQWLLERKIRRQRNVQSFKSFWYLHKMREKFTAQIQPRNKQNQQKRQPIDRFMRKSPQTQSENDQRRCHTKRLNWRCDSIFRKPTTNLWGWRRHCDQPRALGKSKQCCKWEETGDGVSSAHFLWKVEHTRNHERWRVLLTGLGLSLPCTIFRSNWIVPSCSPSI